MGVFACACGGVAVGPGVGIATAVGDAVGLGSSVGVGRGTPVGARAAIGEAPMGGRVADGACTGRGVSAPPQAIAVNVVMREIMNIVARACRIEVLGIGNSETGMGNAYLRGGKGFFKVGDQSG